ncbi:sensor histidine kinase [Leeuwenhoekiella polynyae]|uniref:histidine kinase n=1 Tax=Leeuwenhoekiella polynyae TaxID=1550906 RepID=A0A4Q0P2S2_9FLAO|nr:ATP-binding protein [Leeuwenhoekiella polynyae]RXG20591.1 two-component system phosphate regulon sensor histidine kinase PhoR [Leeuwenhoekiella polynyae]
MAAKFKKSYRFAVFSSSMITVALTLFVSVFFYLKNTFDWSFTLLFFVVCFAFSFVLIQVRVERFIYKRVKKIYDDVSLLDVTTLRRGQVTTDMNTLTKEVERFAASKKLEIESLKIREEYRKEFMGNVAHELKTPLFTTQGYILTLLDGAMKDKSVRKKYLKRAAAAVERLVYLVSDLDMISKLEVGDLNLRYEYFDMVVLVKDTFELLEMKASKKNITLTTDMDYNEPIYVNADRERIQQLLTNLIVNSIKYGKQDGTTEISIENLIQNKVIVRVTDNGEGIAKEHIPRLFERFYRVDKSGSRREGGSGLGLSIVKHIIEAHDEKIYIESDFGVGSEFSFTLEKAEELPKTSAVETSLVE